MANLGETAEIVNCENLTLDVGSDTYILLEDLEIHIVVPSFALSREVLTCGVEKRPSSLRFPVERKQPSPGPRQLHALPG